MAVQPAGPNAWNLSQLKKNEAATTNKSHSNLPAAAVWHPNHGRGRGNDGRGGRGGGGRGSAGRAGHMQTTTTGFKLQPQQTQPAGAQPAQNSGFNFVGPQPQAKPHQHSNSPATPRRRPPALRMEYLALAVVALAWLYYAAFNVFSWMGGGDRGGGASPAQ